MVLMNTATTEAAHGSYQEHSHRLLRAPMMYVSETGHTLPCVIVLNPALVITQPAVLSATVTSTDVACNGANDGTITIYESSWRIWNICIYDQWRSRMADLGNFQLPGSGHL